VGIAKNNENTKYNDEMSHLQFHFLKQLQSSITVGWNNCIISVGWKKLHPQQTSTHQCTPFVIIYLFGYPHEKNVWDYSANSCAHLPPISIIDEL